MQIWQLLRFRVVFFSFLNCVCITNNNRLFSINDLCPSFFNVVLSNEETSFQPPSMVCVDNHPMSLMPSDSSKEMGFYNPRSHLDSTVVTYCPHAAEKRGDR